MEDERMVFPQYHKHGDLLTKSLFGLHTVVLNSDE